MTTDPLREWGRLTNENTKHEVVSAAYVGVLSNSPNLESFNTWLLVGTGATATLLVTNIQPITTVISQFGFKVCFSLLTLSGVIGLFAKSASVFFPASGEAQAALQERIAQIYMKHGAEREKIEGAAVAQGCVIPPDLALKDVLEEYIKPFPCWSKWLLSRYFAKKGSDRQASFDVPLRSFIWQCNLCALQTVFFVLFMVAVVWFT